MTELTAKQKAARFDRIQEINKLSYKRRQARIKLERAAYAQAVADGKIDPVTDEEVEAAM